MLHPVAGGAQKRWPAEKFAQLARGSPGGVLCGRSAGPADGELEPEFGGPPRIMTDG
jgi:hypothetical protein